MHTNYMAASKALLLVVVSFGQLCDSLDLIGANLEGIADWSRSHSFVDLTKQSRQLGQPFTPWNTTGLPVVDSTGWPITDFGIILWIDSLTPMNGTYKISYIADSKPIINFVASSGIIANHLFNATLKKGTADLVFPANGQQLMLSFTNTTKGLRNLRVIRPGYDPVNPPTFTTAFLNANQRFNTFRFMDWGVTNANPITSWSQRPTRDSVTYTGSYGVPLETMIELGNTLKKNIWINIPHQADANYINNTAYLLKSLYNVSNGSIYVEYSNEVWNWQFSQAHWNLQQATNEVNQSSSSNLNYDSKNNPGYWAWRRTARSIKQISDIFRSVFGDAQMMKKIRPILAGQIAYSEGMKTGLKFINDVYGPPNKYLYGIAGAPYFNLNGGDVANLSVSQVLNLLNQSIQSIQNDNGIYDYALLGSWYGLPVLAYEGGSDTFGPNNINAKKNASFDPTMQTLCYNYLTSWFNFGFDLFNWFGSFATNHDTQYGTWGLTDVMTNNNTPKTRAIDAIRSLITKPSILVGLPVPGVIDGRQFHGSNRTAWMKSANLIVYADQAYDYLIRANSSINGFLTLTIATVSSPAVLLVQVNNNNGSVVTIQNNNNIPTVQQFLNVSFSSGLNDLRLTSRNSTSFTVISFSVSSSMPVPIITSPSSLTSIATVTLRYQIIAVNFPSSFTATGLPLGLTLNPTTGLISGSTNSSGNYTISLGAVSSAGTGTAQLALIIMSSLLLKEPFNYTNGTTLNGANGGDGFGANNAWQVQNNNNNSYFIASSQPLSNGSGTAYATGGGLYLTSGRKIDTSVRFRSLLSSNGLDIGAYNTSLWLGFVIRKQMSSNQKCFVALHPMTVPWWASGPTLLSVGYFGSQSNINNTKYWSLQYAGLNTSLAMTKPVVLNQTTYLVAKISFGAVDNQDIVSLFVNPSAEVEPTKPDAQLTSISVRFRNVGYYAGDGQAESSLDDIKIGVNYKSLAL